MLNRKVIFFTVAILFSIQNIKSQSGFQFYGANTDAQRVRFQLINNLIVFPIEINGKQLSFILDTGVTKTILFSLRTSDSLVVKDVRNVTLSGLGKGDPAKALLAKNNTFRIKDMMSSDEDLYIVAEGAIDLSSKMGTTIHGIIGYNLLKDIVVKIDYRNKFLEFINPKAFNSESCKRCEEFPIQIRNRKPFINGKLVLEDSIGVKNIDVKLLIDSGGSDAVWLFENSKPSIAPPKKFFNDILGEGLSGTIYGKRSRVKGFKLGSFLLKEPTVSYLDSLSTSKALNFKERNGSLGGDILRRFRVWIDYPNNRIILKKTGSLTSGFNYNMSGLTIAYNGKKLVRKEQESKNINYGLGNQSTRGQGEVSFVTNYRYVFLPVYKIDGVIPDSPAGLAGIKKGDAIVSINFKLAYDYSLQDILNLFQSKNNKRIVMKIRRNGETMKFKFNLKRKI